ncbi:MAG TPA: maleylpyruvate isomerase family mycothiol-dependent enzyme [Jatrophihabitantaceae bacterium]|nr:maleylpyruvate isomerase family mycothiol-dependent enzyme [Jatrophihabitantaceae bacterium]
MDVDALIDHLAADGPRLAEAATRAGLDAQVPATDWTVRELVTHVGGIHRWAADIVANCGTSFDTAAGEAVGTGPADAELIDWFRAGHAGLVETLRAAPTDLDCATFLPADSPLHFWARRQAHETAVHCVDAEAAAGRVTGFDAAFAQDGIAELLLGFAARKSNAIAQPATIALHAADGPSWLITLGGERIVAEPAAIDKPADATISGTSSDFYLWLWNRASTATVAGDARVAELWRAVRIRWS